MSKFNIDISTPDRPYGSFSGDMLVAPGTEGEFAIMTDHISFLSSLKKGFIRIKNGQTTSEKIAINSGVLKFENNQCIILIDEILEHNEVKDH